MYEDGHIVGIDSGSGSPYPSYSFQSAKLWNNEAEALKFSSHFKDLRVEKIVVEFPFEVKFR